MLDLSIVMVSWNTRELLRACLRSLEAARAAGGVVSEVCVVDNASADGTVDMVRAEFPWVDLLASDENLGFTRGSNLGLMRAAGRHVLLLNPDAEIAPDALTLMVRFLDEHPRAGAVGPRLFYPDGKPQQGVFRFPTLGMVLLDFFPLNHRLTGSRLNGRYREERHTAPFPIDHPLGACLMVRREAMAQVGLLDEDFFLYCEEVDWCLRLKKAGWEVWCVPQAHVTHHAGASTRQVRGPMFVQLYRSRFRLYDKHYSRWFRFWARLITRAGIAWERRRMAARRAELTLAEYDGMMEAYRAVEGL